MDQKVAALIDGWREEFVDALREWIRVPSVKGETEANAPFGKEVRRMLDQAMETGRKAPASSR